MFVPRYELNYQIPLESIDLSLFLHHFDLSIRIRYIYQLNLPVNYLHCCQNNAYHANALRRCVLLREIQLLEMISVVSNLQVDVLGNPQLATKLSFFQARSKSDKVNARVNMASSFMAHSV